MNYGDPVNSALYKRIQKEIHSVCLGLSSCVVFVNDNNSINENCNEKLLRK